MDNIESITVIDLAKLLNIDERTIYRKIRNKELPGMYRVGKHGAIRFVKHEIISWIKHQMAVIN